MTETLPTRYEPQKVEKNIYFYWEKNDFFKAKDTSTKLPFCIILPPPNITGHLHMGHALNHTIQDVMIRWKRMSGFNTLWLPGTDHAGIATQSVVEKKLLKDNIYKKQLGRETFVNRIWEWKNEYGSRICKQMKKLGNSCDWSRLTFTLDPNVSQAVRKVFVHLYQKNLIYKGEKLINWSTKLETAISDLEVEYKDINGSLWYIKYPIENENTFLTIATTRPETMLGDTALCVNPYDERYQKYIGKYALIPLINRKIKIISDSYVDKNFGSGVLKITPAHDFNDYQIGKTHNLDFINIINEDGTLNKNAQKYEGLSIKEARKKIIEDLKIQNLLFKEEPHTHSVGHCSRSGVAVEPYLSKQWFIKTKPLSIPAKRVVESGTIKFYPDSWSKTYLHWMNIIEDWCISRQLWWGHQIPAWYCNDCNHITVTENDPSKCEKCKSKNIIQEEDVLDTWFSSALWPFSTMNWPEENETQKTFYPTNFMITGHDIIFFWVARMIMMGLEFKNDVPFRTVYIHGLIRDEKGQKMSKSLGNSIDPVEIINEYGADALRFTLISQLATGKDLKFSMERLEGYRNFMNKIWNATRFTLGFLKDFQIENTINDTQKSPKESSKNLFNDYINEDISNTNVSYKDISDEDILKNNQEVLPNKQFISIYDQWIIYKLSETIDKINFALETNKFSEAANIIYAFTWYEFCDWYLEFIKPLVNNNINDSSSDLKSNISLKEKTAAQTTLCLVLNRVLKLLHPFIPFITEELYQKLPIKNKALIIDSFPSEKNDNKFLSLKNEYSYTTVELIKEIILSIRNIRGENNIKINQKIPVLININQNNEIKEIIEGNKKAIITLAKLGSLEITNEIKKEKNAISLINYKQEKIKIIIPLEGLINFDEEIKRINKNIEKLEKNIFSLNKRLNNKNFIKNAPKDIIENNRNLLQQYYSQINNLKDSLKKLKTNNKN